MKECTNCKEIKKLKVSSSIDRKDTSNGYTINNIRWITFSENCSIANHSR